MRKHQVTVRDNVGDSRVCVRDNLQCRLFDANPRLLGRKDGLHELDRFVCSSLSWGHIKLVLDFGDFDVGQEARLVQLFQQIPGQSLRFPVKGGELWLTFRFRKNPECLLRTLDYLGQLPGFLVSFKVFVVFFFYKSHHPVDQFWKALGQLSGARLVPHRVKNTCYL